MNRALWNVAGLLGVCIAAPMTLAPAPAAAAPPPRLEGAQEPLGELIKLAVRDGMIRIDTKGWPAAAALLTSDRCLADLEEMYRRQGHRRELAQRLARSRMSRLEDGRPYADVELLFHAVKTALNMENGGASSSGGDRLLHGERPNATLVLAIDEDSAQVRLHFIQEAPVLELLQIEDQGGNAFRLTAKTAAFSIVLLQSKGGAVQLTCRQGDDAEALTADSLDEFRAAQPAVYGKIVAQLNRWGVEGLPPSE